MTNLRDELLNAPEVPPLHEHADTSGGPPPHDGPPDGPGDEDQGAAADGGRDWDEGRPWGEIWKGCPVKALGVFGEVSFYLDVTGQLRGVDNHTGQKMLHLFGGRVGLLASKFPRMSKAGIIPRSFDQGHLSAAMIAACEERGVWSPTNKVRGPGSWTDEDGGLIVHAGDEVFFDGQWQEPGIYGQHVYPAGDAIPRPSEAARRTSAARDLLEILATWKWRRPDIDAQLMLGLIMAQMLGGALEWRPVGWLTGDQATGKSTLQNLLLHVHGGTSGLLQAADATDAGIRSVVGYSSLPVAVDELEPDADNPRKVKAVIELARRASSGAQIFRGSSDQKGHQSNAFSCFLFSSILVPPMPSQDRSRLILMDLDKIPPDARKIKLDTRKLRAIGAELRRTVLDAWDTWPERLAEWRGALADAGQTGRGADNYGTVLALADMALNPTPQGGDVARAWAGKLGHALTEDSVEVGSNAEDMLVHLLSQPIDVFRRGRKHTVAEWLQFAGNVDGSPDQLADVSDIAAANRILASFGLRVRGRKREANVLIANAPLQQLADLFKDTQWANGAWAQATRRVDGAEVGVPGTFNGIRSRAQAIPFTSMPGLLSLPTSREADATAKAATADDLEDFA